jgi:hypothetical protein
MVDGGNWVADLYSTKLLKDLANSNVFIYQSFWIKILRFLGINQSSSCACIQYF